MKILKMSRAGFGWGTVAAMLLLGTVWLAGTANAQEEPDGIVRLVTNGDSAPVTPAATFSGTFEFDEPMVNVLGDVAFLGNLSDSRVGLFLVPNGTTIAKVAVSGDAIGTLGTLSTDFDGPAINHQRSVAFVNRGMTGGSTTATLFVKKWGQPVKALLKQGDSAPGTASGIFTSFDDLAINNIGDIAVIAEYTEAATPKVGVFMVSHLGNVSAVLVDGNALPGTGGGVYDGLTADGFLDGPWINDKGAVAFQPEAITGGTGGFGESVFVRVGKGPIQSLLLMGETVPGTGGKTVDGINLGRPALDNSNTLGAKVTFSAGAESAMVTKPLGLTMNVCVQDLTSAPDTAFGATFDGFAAPSFSNHVLTFFSDILGDASTNGLFYCQQVTAHESILSADTKPGGGTYNTLEESSTIGNFNVFVDEEGSPEGLYRVNVQPGSSLN